MKTTEVFVEQVLIGFLVLITLTLPFVGLTSFDVGTGAEAVTKALGLVGVAYLLGIPFDRFADSLVSGLEKRLRALFVLKLEPNDAADPFPENLLKVRVRLAGDGVAEWMGYLRTRIRLARALTVFVPALALAGTLQDWPGRVWSQIALLLAAGIAYVAGLVTAQRAAKPIPRSRKVHARREQRAEWRWQRDPAVAALGFVCAIAFVTAIVRLVIHGRYEPIIFASAGTALAFLSGWTWRRVTKTYWRFLRDFRTVEASPGSA